MTMAVTAAVVAVAVLAPSDEGVRAAPDPGSSPAVPIPDPITPPDPPPAPPGSFAFLETDSVGNPVRFDPCGPTIRVLYNSAGAPYAADSDVVAAAASLEAAMGHDNEVNRSRESWDTFTPRDDELEILVTWVLDVTGFEEAGDGTLGEGGPIVRDGEIVAGRVRLVANGNLTPGFGPDSWGGVILHELGHAVGLAHVLDPEEQMYPIVQLTRSAGWGPGDLVGLALVGGACEAPGSTTTKEKT